MNMICRSVVPPVKLIEPNVRSNEVASGLPVSHNTLRILKTIKPVTRAFTTMDAVRPVKINVSPQGAFKRLLFSIVIAPSDTSQVTRGE